MRIAVAYKWAADPHEARVGADGDVDLGRARPEISDYDAVAFEVAAQLADGGEVVGVSVGGAALASPMALKTALSRGLDRAVVVADEVLDGAGTTATAMALAGVIRHLGEVDLVLAGDCSIDTGARLVPAVLGGFLGWPVLTDVTAVRAGSEGVLHVDRATLEGTEVVELTAPAVLTVAADAAVPRVPGMKDILAAARKPSERLQPADVGLTAEQVTGLIGTVRNRVPAPRAARRRQLIDTADPAAAAAELVAALRQGGVW